MQGVSRLEAALATSRTTISQELQTAALQQTTASAAEGQAVISGASSPRRSGSSSSAAASPEVARPLTPARNAPRRPVMQGSPPQPPPLAPAPPPQGDWSLICNADFIDSAQHWRPALQGL